MRRVYKEDWSPRSQAPPAQSNPAYSLPAGTPPSSYGDYFNNNLPAVEDLGPLQQYIGSYNDSYVEANVPNLSHFTNSVAEDQGNWFQALPQSHAGYNEALSRSITEPAVAIQTGDETVRPQQEVPGTFVVLITCTTTSDTKRANTHCDIHDMHTDPSRRVRGLVIWPLSGIVPVF
jgi:hypothetical protein